MKFLDLKNLVSTYSKNTVLRNILLVGVITLIIKVFSFYKETLVASTFGLSVLLDTFLIAILIPSFIQNVFINALKNIFIPNYIIEQNNGGNTSQFQSVIYIITLSISFFFFIIIYLSSDFILIKLFPGHTPEYYDLITNQLFYLLPCLFLWGINSILSGLLEIENKYFLSTISGIFSPICVILCLFFFRDALGDMVLAISMLIGAIVALIYTIIISLKNNLICLKKPKLNANSLMMLKQLPPKVSSGLLSSMNDFVDQFFAAQLAIGSIAAINYGIKVPSLIVSIVIMAMGNVLLPYFSRLISTNLLDAYNQLFKILKLVFFTSFIISIIIIIFSNDIISILFERNQFDSDDVLIVSDLQKLSFIYIPFLLCTLILVRFLTSINKNKFMAWVSFFSLLANIILNSILIEKFEIYGLLIATIIIHLFSFIFYVYFTHKQYRFAKLCTN
ncbi:virulence factor MviN [Hyunsoonleella flava]|uniref:Virulence factor MviN n=1 Tax=Hyunsoonleella flava TaxID=2527939 RepID=A0A4V2JAJ7_9FLAO|nr:lipid II flippase MurJ [Hyunsoonleella flava]TBN06526.1 virulence factor MviN [Hyunsoonleella flava]